MSRSLSMILHLREKSRISPLSCPFLAVPSLELDLQYSCISAYLQIQIYLPLCLFFLFHLLLSLCLCLSLVLHKCQLPYLKAFSADLRGSLYRSHYKSLTPVILCCWYSSTIFYFVCFVTEGFGPEPRKGTLGLSRGLTEIKCEYNQVALVLLPTLANLCPCPFVFFFRPLR